MSVLAIAPVARAEEPSSRRITHVFDPRVAFATTTVGSGYGLGAVGAL